MFAILLLGPGYFNPDGSIGLGTYILQWTGKLPSGVLKLLKIARPLSFQVCTNNSFGTFELC